MQSNPSREKRSLFPVLVAVVVTVLVVTLAMWTIFVRNPTQANVQMNRKSMETVVGLANPVKNILDSKFTDADGDLVADAPTDPAKLIDPPVIFFSYIASDKAEEYKKIWSSFTEHLSGVTGKPVEYVIYKTTDEQLRAFRDGKLHVTGLNTGSLPVAVNLAGFVPAAQLGSDKGATVVRTEFIVPAKSPVTDLKGIVGHTVTLTEPNSNSGYKAPILLLKDKGFSLVTDYDIRNSSSHDQSIEGIARGEYEIAAVASDMLGRAISIGTIKQEQVRVLYSSESFPAAGLGYAYNLKPELAAKIKEAILSFQFKGSSLETDFVPAGQDRFVPVNYKDDWKLIRRIDNEIGRQQQIKDAESDDDITDATTQPTTAPAT